MILVENFDMFKALLLFIKESNSPYKIIGDYRDESPNVVASDKEPMSVKTNYKFLVIASVATFVYQESIEFSNFNYKDIKELFEQLDFIKSNVSIVSNKITIH